MIHIARFNDSQLHTHYTKPWQHLLDIANMDVSTYLVGLESNTVDEYHNTLCCFTFVAGIAAIMHWHFKRFINSTVDVVFG